MTPEQTNMLLIVGYFVISGIISGIVAWASDEHNPIIMVVGLSWGPLLFALVVLSPLIITYAVTKYVMTKLFTPSPGEAEPK